MNSKLKSFPGPEYPDYLQNLFTSTDEDSKNFLDNIRSFNSAFAFSSLGFDQGCGQVQIPGRGVPVYKVHGAIYHRVSNAVASNGQRAQYGQLYFLDAGKKSILIRLNSQIDEEKHGIGPKKSLSDEALAIRRQVPANSDCKLSILQQLDALLRQINPFAHDA